MERKSETSLLIGAIQYSLPVVILWHFVVDYGLYFSGDDQFRRAVFQSRRKDRQLYVAVGLHVSDRVFQRARRQCRRRVSSLIVRAS